VLLLPANSLSQTVRSSQPPLMLFPAVIPRAIRRNHDLPAAIPSGPTICLPPRSILCRTELSRIRFEGDYQPTGREIQACYLLAAKLLERTVWDGLKRIIFHEVDKLRYLAVQELDVHVGMAFVDVLGPMSYKDTKRKWEGKTRGNSGRSTYKQYVKGSFAGNRAVIYGA